MQSLALLALGWLARREGNATLAATLFKEGLALQPETTDTAAALHFYLGALLGTPQGDLAKAIDHYAAVLALKPNWPTLYYNRARPISTGPCFPRTKRRTCSWRWRT